MHVVAVRRLRALNIMYIQSSRGDNLLYPMVMCQRVLTVGVKLNGTSVDLVVSVVRVRDGCFMRFYRPVLVNDHY